MKSSLRKRIARLGGDSRRVPFDHAGERVFLTQAELRQLYSRIDGATRGKLPCEMKG